MIIRYFFTVYVVVSVSPLSSCLPFSRFPFQSLIFAPKYLLYTPRSLATFFQVLYSARCTSGGGGSHGWRGGVPGLTQFLNQACGLTHQPDSWLQIPVQIPFPQGTGEPSSADHTWVGPYDRDCDATVYPPPYLQKDFVPFFCHDSTQLREYNQGFPP